MTWSESSSGVSTPKEWEAEERASRSPNSEASITTGGEAEFLKGWEKSSKNN